MEDLIGHFVDQFGNGNEVAIGEDGEAGDAVGAAKEAIDTTADELDFGLAAEGDVAV